MAHSYFELIDDTPEEGDESRRIGHFRATEHTVGPWSAQLMHGGPPSALAVAMAERTVAGATGRTDLAPRRVAVDFVGAVPMADLEVRTRIIRGARSAALVEVTFSSGSGSGARDCLSARVWFVRDTPTDHLVDETARRVDNQVDLDAPTEGLGLDFGYGASIEWRYVFGSINAPGPAAVWGRPRLPLVQGWSYSSLGRVVLLADSASGVSAELDWSTWSFVNVDLDVHLARPVAGEWILLDAATQLGPTGSALARSTISDERGVAGGGLQTLVLAPISK